MEGVLKMGGVVGVFEPGRSCWCVDALGLRKRGGGEGADQLTEYDGCFSINTDFGCLLCNYDRASTMYIILLRAGSGYYRRLPVPSVDFAELLPDPDLLGSCWCGASANFSRGPTETEITEPEFDHLRKFDCSFRSRHFERSCLDAVLDTADASKDAS